MGRTSTASKRKYNEKAYDRVAMTVPKGTRDEIRSHAEKRGESVNGFLSRAVRETISRDDLADGQPEEVTGDSSGGSGGN